MTLVMVTHNIEEAVFLGQNIIVMGKGKIRHIIENPHFRGSGFQGRILIFIKYV